MSRLPYNYPRQRVRIDISQFRRKPLACFERAGVDRVILTRCGKDLFVIIHHGYYQLLIAAARRGNCGAARNVRKAGPRPKWKKATKRYREMHAMRMKCFL